MGTDRRSCLRSASLESMSSDRNVMSRLYDNNTSDLFKKLFIVNCLFNSTLKCNHFFHSEVSCVLRT